MHSTEVRADGDGARDTGVRAGESERQRFRTKTETSGENAEGEGIGETQLEKGDGDKTQLVDGSGCGVRRQLGEAW